MKLKLSKIAAAIGLAAAAAPAFAAIGYEDQLTELFAVVWDENVGSYALDLGLTLDAFIASASTPGYSFSYAVGPAYASYVAADTNLNDGSKFEGTRWAIFATDVQSFGDPGEADGFRYLTTTYTTEKYDVDNIVLSGGTGSVRFQAGDINATGTHTADTAVNGESFNPVGTLGAFREIDNTFLVGAGVVAGNSINTSAAFSYYYTSSYDPFEDATRVDLPGVVNFDGTNFTYGVAVAIPEPGTYALMLAGLAAVGFVARRRA